MAPRINTGYFKSDLSTTDQADEISGRGIGMDAIRSLLQRERGFIDLLFTAERAVDGFRPFVLELRIPAPLRIAPGEKSAA